MLRKNSKDVALDNDLLTEKELIAIYINMVGHGTHCSYATSQIMELVSGISQDSESEDFHKGLDLIKLMRHQGLESNLGLDLPIQKDFVKEELTNDVSNIEGGSTRSLFCDSDLDSLMECGDTLLPLNFEPSLSIPDSLSVKFDILQMLGSIQARHMSISLNFQSAQMRLKKLREDSRFDADFLGKLNVSNEHMRERIHELKTDVSCLLKDLNVIKKWGYVEPEYCFTSYDSPGFRKKQFRLEFKPKFFAKLEDHSSINPTNMTKDRLAYDEKKIYTKTNERTNSTQNDMSSHVHFVAESKRKWKTLAVEPVYHVKTRDVGIVVSEPVNGLQQPLSGLLALSKSVSIILVCLLGWWITYKCN